MPGKLTKKNYISLTRLPSTLEAANHWSGGRPASFQHKGRDCELQWLTMFFMSPVVLMVTTSPQSCRGILPRRLGKQLGNLPKGDTIMQPLLCLLRFYQLSAQKYFNNVKEIYSHHILVALPLLMQEKSGDHPPHPKWVKRGHLLSDYRQKCVNGTK